MRKVPEIRFDGFDGEWEETKIGSLSKVVRGASPRPISDQKWFDGNSDVGWLRISDVTTQNGRIHELEQKLSIDGQKKTRVYRTPHLILSIAASVGKPVINYINTGVHDGFIIFEEPKFDLEYMFQRLDSIQLSWSKYGQPGSQVNLNSDIVKNRRTNLPHLEEQGKIGELFRKIDDLIEIQERTIAKIEDYKKSMLQKMFPKKGELVPEFRFDGFDEEWKMDKLKNILNYRRGSFPQPYTEDSWYGGEGSMPFVQVNDVENDSFKLKYPTNKTISTLAMPKSVFVEKGTILVTIQGSIGRIALTQYDSYVDRTLLIITDNIIEFDKYFLINVLYLLFYKEKFKASGGTIKSITTKKLGDFKISFPSIEEQAKIGRFFKNLDTQIENEDRLLDSYKMMKKSLLQKMFV